MRFLDSSEVRRDCSGTRGGWIWRFEGRRSMSGAEAGGEGGERRAVGVNEGVREGGGGLEVIEMKLVYSSRWTMRLQGSGGIGETGERVDEEKLGAVSVIKLSL